jgi:GNAT superfamily N-acetyltransferase
LRITVPENALPEHRDAVAAPLRAYNLAQAGDPQVQLVAILLENDAGTADGGLWGRIAFGWLFVELLGLPDAARGQGWGRKLMQRAEVIAREAGCTGIWLDTFDFQAPGFYEKLGFVQFGAIADYPPGHTRYFYQKRLD